MKPLSERQARNCEEARCPVCKCRCGGAMHGIKRAGDSPPRTFYEQLPDGDPHQVKPKKPKKERLIQLALPLPELEAAHA